MSLGRRAAIAVAAWLVPGLGHLLLGRRSRALLFAVLVVGSVVLGCQLQGNLYHVVPDNRLSLLATAAMVGLGTPYFYLRFVAGYRGEVVEVGWEYGTAFLLTAALMNLLLVLDALDIARGAKE